MLTIASLAKA